jgi:hypothetical protein
VEPRESQRSVQLHSQSAGDKVYDTAHP